MHGDDDDDDCPCCLLNSCSFARLGAGIALGTFQESAKRLWGGQDRSQNQQFAFSPFINEQNAERLALGLCRMRGAALKLGQMLSIQDESLLPPQVIQHILPNSI